jgi:hypothetical protein
MKLSNSLVFFIASLLIIVVVGLSLLTDIFGEPAIGILILTTTFTGIGSIATFIQAAEIQRGREEGERPEIAVYMKPQNMLMYCVVENLGKLPARDITITFNPSPIKQDGGLLQDISLFSNKIPYLPPNEVYRRHLGASPAVLELNKKPFEIIIQYNSTSGKKYKDSIVIDLSVLADANHPASTIQEELATMSKYLKQIVQVLEASTDDNSFFP